mmetsp:Transcript_5178/g.7785  ORF Transcript_5178/g.7785 Transcript_5178/m.7785 type:complete len:273 (+) Transcript_5178:966-1784(+)
MVSGCRSDAQCWAGSTIFDFNPAPASLCLPAARYALASSCLVPQRSQATFLSDIDAYLAGSRESCSSTGSTETMTTTNAGAGPDSLTHQSCYDNSDCDFACFAADWTFYREFSLISIQSSYVGSCDCSVRGLFRGHIDYQDGVRIHAVNGLGQNFSTTAARSINQIQARIAVDGTQTCDYALDFAAGLLFGLPSEQTTPSSPNANLDFLGYSDELSNPPNPVNLQFRRQRHAHAGSSATGPSAQGERRAVAPVDPRELLCPQEEDDCRSMRA